MSQDNNDSRNPKTRRVVLPSGKTIEVVDANESAFRPKEPSSRALHVCPDCSSELVYPTAWEEAGGERWKLSLRCPDCWWEDDGIFERETVGDFDDQLDRGTHALLVDLKQLMHANMKAEIDRFAAALEADAILPMDF